SGKAAAIAGRPVEYLVRVFRNPDRLRAAERQHEPHLPVAWIERRQFAGAVGRGAADGIARPADHRPYVGSDVAREARTAAAVFRCRRLARGAVAAPDAF